MDYAIITITPDKDSLPLMISYGVKGEAQSPVPIPEGGLTMEISERSGVTEVTISLASTSSTTKREGQ